MRLAPLRRLGWRAATAAAAPMVRADRLVEARQSGPKRVLLVVKNRLMAEVLREAIAPLRDDPRLSFSLTTALKSLRALLRSRETARSLGVAHVDFPRAVCSWWDLALFANHDAPWLFHRDIPKIRLRHGLSEKLVHGLSFIYDPLWTVRDDGSPIYERIFESNALVGDRVERCYPALRGRVALVGSLEVDALLEKRPERAAIRRELGVAEDTPLIILASTWKRGCLIDSMGEQLVQEASRLMRRRGWRFVVSVHPAQWRRRKRGLTTWGDWLARLRQRGFIVSEPHRDLLSHYAAGDVMVVDHSGVSLLFAALGRPIIAAPVPRAVRVSRISRALSWVPLSAPDVLSPESAAVRLRDSSLQLERVEQLEERITAALSRPPPPIGAQLNAHPGEAARRIRAEIYACLRLSPPS